jgi:alpha-beta hydrolase superfamily lysophospholipase
VLQRELDDLMLGLAANDLAALACDLPGHGWLSSRLLAAHLSRMLHQRLERGWSAKRTPMSSSVGPS